MKERITIKKEAGILIITNKNFERIDCTGDYDLKNKLWRVEVKLKK